MKSSETAIRFRELHDHPGHPLILPNIWDAGGALMVERLGAQAVATTSAGVAWSLGYGDGNRLPVDKLAHRAREIVDVVKIPVSIDVEAGYSDNPAAVVEDLAHLFEVGVAGINIEDGRSAPDLLARKIEGIKRWLAAEGLDAFVNARTDVYLAGLAADEAKVAEVLRREALYRTAGADGLFVPCIVDDREIEAIVSGSKMPVNVMAMPALPNAGHLAALGVRRISAGQQHLPGNVANRPCSEREVPGHRRFEHFRPGDGIFRSSADIRGSSMTEAM